MGFVGEACLRIHDAEATIARASEKLRAFTIAQGYQGSDYVFDFDASRALVRAEPDVLWIHVESDEITICAGTKMLLEATIRDFASSMPTCLLWVRGAKEPFKIIMDLENQ